MLNSLTKLIWILSYSSIKHIEAFNQISLTELIKDSIVLFNDFISELNEYVFVNGENNLNKEINLSKENLNILLLSYAFFNNDQNFSNMKIPNIINKNTYKTKNEINEGDNIVKKTKSLNVKSFNKPDSKQTIPILSNNINIDFLHQINIFDYDMMNFIEYQNYIIFAKLIEINLKNRTKILESTSFNKNRNFIKFHFDLDSSITDESKIENFDYYKEKYNGVKNINKDIIYLLDPAFHLKTIINESLKDQFVFLNQPYDYFKISDSVSGKVKVRRELAKRLKINYIEYDFFEFLNYSNMREADFLLTPENFGEYSERIQEYITVKNEVYMK